MTIDEIREEIFALEDAIEEILWEGGKVPKDMTARLKALRKRSRKEEKQLESA